MNTDCNSTSKSPRLVKVFDMTALQKAVQVSYERELEELTQKEQEKYREYIRVMAEIDWPAYINGDADFHATIVDKFINEGIDAVISEIYDYYDAVYLKGLETDIEELEIIRSDRLPLFHEAFLLYQLGYYYGAVSILLSQIVGITSDIEQYLKRNKKWYSPKTMELRNNRYRLNRESDSSRIITAVVEGKSLNEEQGEYNYLIGYLRFKIFAANLSEEEQRNHPSRNLVYHGAQLNYGTKEHAMKAILCIDALIWVAEVISDEDDEELN